MEIYDAAIYFKEDVASGRMGFELAPTRAQMLLTITATFLISMAP